MLVDLIEDQVREVVIEEPKAGPREHAKWPDEIGPGDGEGSFRQEQFDVLIAFA
jgi:hypothetical protein